ncbi:hypothetical protein DB313_06065 (plasmid) [Borrelia turcica IST7]|uniref:DUF244 domain-containing protein n=1 Tax=Borrelia turcica IST7 TaxID=1104446 RepID=A0A386PNL4_9SPIR|nr:DUF244 domain-containing protein [Borrelia turcica]AYE37066.1 hypothetical protein DB313_06065 [Borrelia turcica IST7]
MFFLVGDTPINCLINRNNAFVAKILEYVLLLENEIISLRQFMEHDREVNVYGLDEEELACYIEKLVTGSNFYSKLADFDYVSEFVEFVECVKLELEESSAICLETNIEKIREFKACLKEYEREHTRVTKPIKDDIKRLLEVVNTQNPLIESESVAYRFGDKIFSLNMSKRAIADKLTLYSKPKILDTTAPTEDVSGISRWLNLDYSPIITDVSNLAFAN